MEVNKVATALVAIVITIVVIGTVAVPIVDEAVTGTSYKGTNTNYESRYTLLDSSPTFTLERASNGTITLTQGGSTRTVNMDGNPAVIVSDALAMRVTSTAIVYWQFLDGRNFETIRDMSTSFTLTVTSGSYTLDLINTEYPDGVEWAAGTMNFAMLKDPSGAWGVFTNQGFKITVGQGYYIGSIYGSERFGPTRLIEATGNQVGESIIIPVSSSGNAVINAPNVTYDINYIESDGSQKVGLISGITSTWGSNSVTEFHAWAPLDFKSTATGDAGTDGLLLSIIPVLLIIVAIMMAVRVLRGD